MRGGRRDRNHSEIKRHAESLGFTVFDTADLAGGFCDLILIKNKYVFFVEVKDGEKPPSQKKLTPDEIKFKEKIEAQECNFIIAETNECINKLFKQTL